jgi:hypothetical protein
LINIFNFVIPLFNEVQKNGSIKNILRSKVYHNFLRPRSALNGKKPSETTGIKLDLAIYGKY